MRPLILSTSEDAFTASGKSPMSCVRAVRKQIAEAVALESPAGLEAVLEQPREQGFVFGERHHAIADVARRQHVELAAQAAGTAAIVGDRDHRRDVHQRTAARPGVALQALQQGGETRASADGDHAQRFGVRHGGRVP